MDTQRDADGAVDRADLSEAKVVEAALRLARRVGIPGLTMRALAEELGVTTMATYYYIPSKDDLLDKVADTVLSNVAIRKDGRPWPDQLWDLYCDVRDESGKYLGLLAYITRRKLLPAGRRLVEDAVALLCDQGFSSEDATWAFSIVYSYLSGRIMLRQPTDRHSASSEWSGRGFWADIDSEANIEYGYWALVRGMLAGPRPNGR